MFSKLVAHARHHVFDQCCFTYAQSAIRCASAGGRLPAINEYIAVMNGGPVLDAATDATTPPLGTP
jgi:hypothetical protein